ncbi:MAG: HAD family phosphatase [Bacteroidaceae bacterium]|nr:HAD family phosphatase [Bacteroidaceae bacterium]MCI6802688.1 HAD family phosphatase [Prevotellaceae bacterium]MDD6016973.1 HAD family phosphatase [Prevotellaceae bacterium]MDD7527079.1 HAD family phosphatase [Prevotellaceae bacterium]MDY5759993.1 HAD family phosphatase [Bacteroidaceae bacterium]
MTKTIIFDLGGVLLDIDLKHCMQQMQALGIDLSVFEKKEMTIPAGTKAAVLGEGIVANAAMHLYQTGDITTEVFLEGIRKYCKEGTTREQVLEAWNACCIAIPPYRLEKLKELKQRGYTICMLSNTNDAHWQKIVNQCFGGQDVVNQLFDYTFLSQEMHMAKPNDGIYLKVLEDIGAKAEECLFIDDSTPNVEAAKKLGFHTLHAETSITQKGMVVAPPSTDWTTTIEQFLN